MEEKPPYFDLFNVYFYNCSICNFFTISFLSISKWDYKGNTWLLVRCVPSTSSLITTLSCPKPQECTCGWTNWVYCSVQQWRLHAVWNQGEYFIKSLLQRTWYWSWILVRWLKGGFQEEPIWCISQAVRKWWLFCDWLF